MGSALCTEVGTDTAVEASSGPACIAGVGTAVGTDAGIEAGVQAQLPGKADTGAVEALSRLPPADKERVDNFLRVLKLTGSTPDASTVDSLLRLMRTLPAPEAPRALLATIQAEYPALFARLHESMVRTQQRLATGPGKATPAK